MKDLMKMIGQFGRIAVSGWILEVTVTDVKKVFGTEKLFVEITPNTLEQAGQWINRDSFKASEVK